jgi:glycosyltransferase involved in cell wall biosynthesis
MCKVTVIIPCRNEENYISKCLNSIVETDFPKEFLHVFVCDGQSTDNSRKIIQDFVKQYSYIHLIENKHKTTPQGLNLGIKRSSADINIILGAHSELYPDYINNCVTALQNDNEIGCVGGIIENIYENKNSEAIGLALSSGFGVGNVYFRTGTKEGYVDTVAFGAYKNDVFKKIGLFDETLTRNQDDDFNFRLIKSGFKILLKKNIKSKYYVRASFNKLFRQYYQYGLWKVFVNKKHKTVTTLRQLIPSLFILFLVLGIVLSFFNKTILILFLSILSLYIFMGIKSSFQKSKNLITACKIFYSFLILHFSYGIAYLIGILRFLILNQKPGKTDSKLNR